MSIHLLTLNIKAQDQLSQLLSEDEREYTFYTELEPFVKAIKKLKKTDYVFYDLQLEDTLWAFERLYTNSKRTNLIAFETLTEETNASRQHCQAGVENYLLLPPHMDRAKARFHEVLQSIAKKAAKRKTAKKKRAAATRRQTTTTAATQSIVTTHSTINDAPALPRYLQAQSSSMLSFMAELHSSADNHRIYILEGEDGAEFELVARELNFRGNGDTLPLVVLDPMHLNLSDLEHLTEEATKTECGLYCYVGLSFEFTTPSVEQLMLFLQEIEDAPPTTSKIHLIIGHVEDSESYVPTKALPMLQKIHERSHVLEIPKMATRRDDMAEIAHSLFSTLRIAHPFLTTRTISNCAIKHLESICDTLDYSRATRLIRNSMALCQRDQLTEVELKNFRDDSPTTQHFIESLADEQFFNPPEDSGGEAASS